MTAKLDANQRFIYRAAASTDAALLARSEPVERGSLVLAMPDAQAKGASGAVVLPAAEHVALTDLLAIVKSEFIDQQLGFPHLIMPPRSDTGDALQDVRDYCLVYDFTHQARALSVITKIERIAPASGVAVAPAQGSEISPALRGEFVEEMTGGGYFTADLWDALLADDSEAQNVKLLRARLNDDDAGLCAIVTGQVELRLLALFTRNEMRAKGVGRMLLGHFLQAARETTAPLVSASYAAEGGAEFYYDKYGFARTVGWTAHRPPAPDFFAPG